MNAVAIYLALLFQPATSLRDESPRSCDDLWESESDGWYDCRAEVYDDCECCDY